ncbi:MAG UNVERIFIED_CONTAM: hypothetical protein LVR18_38115 [Planctomycetaceae bacterium]
MNITILLKDFSMNLQRATALCVLLLTAANAWAQQQPETAAGAGTFTVTGDVDRPGNFSFDKHLTVRRGNRRSSSRQRCSECYRPPQRTRSCTIHSPAASVLR